MQCPVITSSVGALGFPIRNGIEALVADSVGEFASALHRLIGSEELRRELGLKAREMIIRSFGWDGIATQFLGLVVEAQRR